jgi:hypothetical protein
MGYIHLMIPVAQIHTISMGPMMVAKYRPKYLSVDTEKVKPFFHFVFCIWEIHDATGCFVDYYII